MSTLKRLVDSEIDEVIESLNGVRIMLKKDKPRSANILASVQAYLMTLRDASRLEAR